MIANCPVTTTAITNARDIFGKDLASVRGKTVRWAPAPVVGDYVAVPRGVIDKNKSVTLAADVFFVDGIAFLLTVLRNIKFITAEHVATRTAKRLSKHLDRVIQVYTRAGFNVRTIFMDGEFEKSRMSCHWWCATLLQQKNMSARRNAPSAQSKSVCEASWVRYHLNSSHGG